MAEVACSALLMRIKTRKYYLEDIHTSRNFVINGKEGDVNLGNQAFNFDTLFADDPELLALLENDPELSSNGVQQITEPFGEVSDFSLSAEWFSGQIEQKVPVAAVPVSTVVVPSPVKEDEKPTQVAEEWLRSVAENPVEQPYIADIDSSPPIKEKKALKRVFNFVFYTFCAAVLVAAAGFALSKNPQKSYFGYRLYTVKTPSMSPQEDSLPGGFDAGDMIIVKMCEPEEIETNDIITFVPDRAGTSFLTHRVVEVLDHLNSTEGIYFVTRGDANNTNDNPISGDMMVGKKVSSIPRMGMCVEFIRDNYIILLVFSGAAIGFILALRYYCTGPKKVKVKGTLPPKVMV